MKDKKTEQVIVSVIMPVYNTEQYLTEAVESVIGQSFTDWELILVDDGSTDGSGELCDQYAGKDRRISVVHTENGGLSCARNTGMKIVAGEFLQFLDSDDWLFPETLEKAVQAAVSQEADIVIFDAQYEWPDHSLHETSSVAPGVYDNKFILEQLVIPRIPPYACNKFCKRELYEGVAFPEGEAWEDVPTTVVPVAKAKKIAVLNEPLYHYRQRDNAITKQAGRDGSIFKWRFLQYVKRYEYLKADYPEIAAAAKSSIIWSGLKYYSFCLRGREYQAERQRVLSFMRLPEMGLGLPEGKVRLIRTAFCSFPSLTAFIVRLRQRIRS